MPMTTEQRKQYNKEQILEKARIRRALKKQETAFNNFGIP